MFLWWTVILFLSIYVLIQIRCFILVGFWRRHFQDIFCPQMIVSIPEALNSPLGDFYTKFLPVKTSNLKGLCFLLSVLHPCSILLRFLSSRGATTPSQRRIISHISKISSRLWHSHHAAYLLITLHIILSRNQRECWIIVGRAIIELIMDSDQNKRRRLNPKDQAFSFNITDLLDIVLQTCLSFMGPWHYQFITGTCCHFQENLDFPERTTRKSAVTLVSCAKFCVNDTLLNDRVRKSLWQPVMAI